MAYARNEAGLVPAPGCPYCGHPSRLVHADVIYPGRGYDGLYWYCQPCQAWVGTHKNSPRAAPLGTLANHSLRRARLVTHAMFDPLWKRESGLAVMSRQAAYAWLAEQLGMEVKKCHIGWFTDSMCRTAQAAIRKLLGAASEAANASEN